jgi:cytidyltransferase-like protein
MGGVAGHMAHLSEDTDLTFNEIVSILGKVANAEITNATEKVDGQNLFLSWTLTPDGEVEIARAGDARTARNAGDIKKGGMTTDEYISKWAGHPAENAFTNGFKAISTALRKLSPEDLEAIFANGQRYVNMEIMYPDNPNIILYSSPNVVLHGLQDFGEEEVTPEMRSLTKQKFTKLVNLVDGAIEKVGDEDWNINGPKLVALKKLADGSALEDVTSKIRTFAAPVGMDATLGDYIEQVVKGYTEQAGMPADVTEKLITLMLRPEEAKEQGITVVNLKKGLPKELQTMVSNLGAKTKSRKYIASILKPIEVAISDFAIEVLRGVKSYFVSDNDAEVARMRAELEQSIAYLKNLQASGDEKMGELVDLQLAKLGNVENLASSMEGIVFEYPPGSDRIYKLTGAFAMANQIIGRARRSGMTEEEILELDIIDDEADDPVVDADYPKTIAVVPGAYKPPHKGHLDMVRKYASKADEVVVIISKPTKQGRYLPDGTEITSDDSLKIWEMMVSGLPNVKIEASENHASPVTAAYDFIGDTGPLNIGDKAILGASTKDDDWKRWLGAEKYVKEGVELLNPEETAVPPSQHSGEYIKLLAMEAEKGSDLYNNMPSVKIGKDPKQYHASDLRFVIVEATKSDVARKMLGDFVGNENIDAVLSVFGLGSVEEISAGAGGAIGGFSAPLQYGSDDDPENTNETKKANKYMDLSLIDEVIELIMKRGIV